MLMNRCIAPLFALAGRIAPPSRRLPWLAILLVACAAGPAAAQEIIPETPASASQWSWPWRWQWPFGARTTTPAPPPGAPAVQAPSTGAAVPAAATAPTTAASGSVRVELPAGQRSGAAAKPVPDDPTWNTLSTAQRAALEPLAREWATIDGDRKRKWIEIAERMPRMSAAQQARMQTRMTEWAHLTPQARGQVRMHFQEARQVAPQNRKESWDAYLALPAEQRRQLADRAALLAPSAAARSDRNAAKPAKGADAVDRDDAQAKSNIVSNPPLAPSPKVIAPTVVQAASGATTTLMSRRPAPPAHQQTGLPKIVAMPGFVDSTTLLPQRGAQGAAVRPVAASEPAMPRR